MGYRPHIPVHHRSDVERGSTYRNALKGGFFGIPQACKLNPKYIALFEKLVEEGKATERIDDSLDAIYIQKCRELNPLGILLFDLNIFGKNLLTIVRGGGK